MVGDVSRPLEWSEHAERPHPAAGDSGHVDGCVGQHWLWCMDPGIGRMVAVAVAGPDAVDTPDRTGGNYTQGAAADSTCMCGVGKVLGGRSSKSPL